MNWFKFPADSHKFPSFPKTPSFASRAKFPEIYRKRSRPLCSPTSHPREVSCFFMQNKRTIPLIATATMTNLFAAGQQKQIETSSSATWLFVRLIASKCASFLSLLDVAEKTCTYPTNSPLLLRCAGQVVGVQNGSGKCCLVAELRLGSLVFRPETDLLTLANYILPDLCKVIYSHAARQRERFGSCCQSPD